MLIASALSSVAGTPAVHASGSQAFSATGSSQTFTVPAGVNEVQVYARGGAGGGDTYGYYLGGRGAYVAAVLQVTPGDVITVNVGAKGSPSVASRTFGGGGAAGNTAWYTSQGGGASDIRIAGASAADRVIVAGGGGGAGSSGIGGSGGTPTGGNGLPSTNASMGGQGGFGATQATGGSGGLAAGGGCGTANGSAGTSELGGNGGAGGGYSGSGGGGGYFGGGGGGGGCNSGAGGGGSSWADPAVTSSVTYALATSATTGGCVEVSWPAGTAASSCTGSAPVADTTAPTLSSSVPADNATGVSATANVVLNFSENVTAVSAKNIVIKKSSDDSTVESISVTDGSKVSVSGSQVTVNPSSTLDDSTGYYVTIDSGAFKDAANNVYAGISSSTALNFTTAADTTAPTLSSSVPADNATGVSATANVVLNFSENVTAVSAKNIVIKKSSDDTTVESISVTDGSKVSVSGSQVTVNPSSTLDDSTGYYVTINSGAFKDAANNVYAGISSSTALNFTTAAAIPTTTTTTDATTTTTPTSTATTLPSSASNSGTTDGGGSTVANPPSNQSSVSTTTVARVTPSASTSTTTSTPTTATTSTSTTLASDSSEDIPAPPAPDVLIGQAAAFVNGEPVDLSISRENNTLTISGAGVTMTLAAVLDDGSIVPLDADGNIRLDETRLLQLTSFGVALESETEVWIYSDPVRLGVLSPDATGSISARLVVPEEVKGGEHRFVVKTRTQSGDETTLALGIGVGAASEGVAFEWLIGVPLALAVAAALIIPATRRRRRAATTG